MAVDAEENSQPDPPTPASRTLRIRGRIIKLVETFCYLGSTVGSGTSLGIAEDVSRRVQKAAWSSGEMKGLWRNKRVSRRTKGRVLMLAISPVLLYGAESWALQKKDKARLQKF